MIKWSYDPNAGRNGDGDGEDAGSEKTVSRKKSDRSYSQKIDKLAKTVRNMGLLKLK